MPENENVAAGSLVFRFRRLAAGEILAMLAAALYLPSLWGRLLWDDLFLIFNYPGRWSALGDIWAGRDSPDYFPLAQTLFWGEARLWNMDVRGYHAVSIALHVTAVVLVWQVLKRLSVPGAWLGALILAVHPVCVESVAWIAEEKNTLSLALYAAALLAYLRFEERPAKRRYAVALGLFVLALLAKTAVVVLPFVLLLCAWWQRGSIQRRDLWRSLPFFAASLVFGLVTVHFQTTTLYLGTSVVNLGLWDRIQQAGEYFWFYLYKAVFPYPLMTLYPSFLPLGIVPDLLAVGAAVALWMNRRTRWGRALCFALAYYALALAPALGFFKMAFWVYAPVADRFQYFALIGITALAGGAIASAPWRLSFRMAAGGALCAILAGAAVYQEGGYKSEVALWTRQARPHPRFGAGPGSSGYGSGRRQAPCRSAGVPAGSGGNQPHGSGRSRRPWRGAAGLGPL